MFPVSILSSSCNRWVWLRVPSRSPWSQTFSDRGANMALFRRHSFSPFRSAGWCWLPTFLFTAAIPWGSGCGAGEGLLAQQFFLFQSSLLWQQAWQSPGNDPQKRLPRGKLQNLFRENDTVGQLTWGTWWYQSGFVGGRNVAPMGWQPGTFVLSGTTLRTMHGCMRQGSGSSLQHSDGNFNQLFLTWSSRHPSKLFLGFAVFSLRLPCTGFPATTCYPSVAGDNCKVAAKVARGLLWEHCSLRARPSLSQLWWIGLVLLLQSELCCGSCANPSVCFQRSLP